MNWYITALKKYAQFSGRSRRKEFWFFVLFNLIVSLVLGFIDSMISGGGDPASPGILTTIYSLAILIPSIAVAVRRLHDTSRSGWWLLIAFIPVIGFFVLIFFYLQDSKPGQNEYGPNPKGA